MKTLKPRLEMLEGVPIPVRNTVIMCDEDKLIEWNGKTYEGFYVSYNNCDIAEYGDVTTALVLGQMQRFYILNGNHLDAYKQLIDKGFGACYEYFMQHESQINTLSDKD